MVKRLGREAGIAVLVLALGGCADAGSGEGAAGVGVDQEYGKPLLGQELSEGKADSFDGLQGPRTDVLSSETAVWEVTRRWYEVSPEAGIAWPADSGLTWDQKYSAWIGAMEKLPSASGSYTTFELLTPWGKKLPAPTLECAETAIFLRITFASWYGLPFFLTAHSPTLGTMHFGHFGIVDADGRRISGYPRFATSYTDYTAQMGSLPTEELLARWPHDENLRGKVLTTLRDDRNAFLGEDAFAGAYFDEVFLNKRVGQFLLRALTNLGSIHLIDARRNTFNATAEAIRPGDIMLERWQARGIGHTLVVKHVEERDGGHLDIEAVYGSMPRIQPRWYDSGLTRQTFTSELTGGEGESYEGDRYVTLGGGLKRWRTPVTKSGRWFNIVPVADRDAYINSTDFDALAARPDRFDALMGELSPEEERDILIQQIETARAALREHPASCSNRERREEAFAKLVELNASAFGIDAETTDRTYRELDDYVFAELVYTESKTCCWNSTTEAMYVLIMALNDQRVQDTATASCNPPLVFKAREGDYAEFRDFAIASGQGDAWVEWSADETCPQADVSDDTETAHQWADFCAIATDLL
ncbi:MAG: hypothetical protein H6744_12665 [Deltaproteobacteria bacterium]|nr:hypothetical protein [Deltaproteobacteria bacterium]MCB9787525.1 hypothetical protein [Deltaproteobacteria bacterium]